MSELTKKLHILKDGTAEEETVTLYSTVDECAEPNLKFEVDGALAYAKLGDVTDVNATSLRIYRDSDSTTYAVLKIAKAVSNSWKDTDGEVHILEESAVEKISNTQFYGNTEIAEAYFPSCKSILSGTAKSGAFANCKNLKEVSMTNAISIGDYAFTDCSSLTAVEASKVESICNYVFMRCSSLKTIDFPLVTTVGKNAFSECSALTSIELPLATDVGNDAFSDCSALTTIRLPMANGFISGFAYCKSLTLLEIPNVTSIGDYSFRGCTSLTSINLPKVTHVGTGTFNNSSLTEVHFAAANQATIEALSGYSSKFGATNATIYFDL